MILKQRSTATAASSLPRLMSSSAGYQQLPQSVHEDDITERQTSTSQRDKRRMVRPDRIDLKKLDSAFKRWASQLLVPSSHVFM